MSSTRKILSWCFFPLTMWYAVGVAFRNFCFLMGFKKQEATPIPTIGLGNLSCGGTGKTPHAEYLLRLLQQHYRVGYLSRGYRRQSRGFVLDDGTADPRQLGDEAAMVARKFPQVIVAVCEKRADGVRKMMALPQPPQVIVMDDSYQHRYVKPTCNILLTDCHHPYFTDHVLPYGDLREFRSGKARANIIIVTKVPEKMNPVARHNIVSELGAQPCQKVFFSQMTFGTPYRAEAGAFAAAAASFAETGASEMGEAVAGETAAAAPASAADLSAGRLLDLGAVEHCLVLTGVAHPSSLVRYLKQYGAVTERLFGDHHAFTADELQQLRQDFADIRAARKVIITTEKDAARLDTPEGRAFLQELPVYAMPVAVRLLNSPDFDFDKIILSSVKENISFLNKLNTTHLGF